MHPCSCKMLVPLQTFLVIVKIPGDSTLFFEQYSYKHTVWRTKQYSIVTLALGSESAFQPTKALCSYGQYWISMADRMVKWWQWFKTQNSDEQYCSCYPYSSDSAFTWQSQWNHIYKYDLQGQLCNLLL